MSKTTVIKGAFVLAFAGILTRFIGFGYRIFLSNFIGAHQLGIYQMIFPVFGICATIYGSGIQTAISHLTASAEKKKPGSSLSALFTGILVSLFLSLSLAGLIGWNAGFIAEKLLMEPNCESSLRILVILFPFCGTASCINGWYYGQQKTAVPAVSQLLEQCIRVLVVFLFASFLSSNTLSGCEIAVAGMCAGEIFSCFFTAMAFLCSKKESSGKFRPSSVFRPLLHIAVPITGNHLIVNLLVSTEAVLIPACLRKYGLSQEQALSIYGTLNGMSIPFIMFPSTITNSLAVLLLPAVAGAKASGNKNQIAHTCSLTIWFCLLVGLLSTSVFLILGNALGNFFFHSSLAGKYLSILAWLCPFLYINTTLGSILNGMNKAGTTLFNNVTGLSIRLLFVLYCIPLRGIEGYLTGLLISQLASCLLDILAISKEIHIAWNLWEWAAKPAITLASAGFLIFRAFSYFSGHSTISDFFCIAGAGTALFLTSVPFFYQCIKSA